MRVWSKVQVVGQREGLQCLPFFLPSRHWALRPLFNLRPRMMRRSSPLLRHARVASAVWGRKGRQRAGGEGGGGVLKHHPDSPGTHHMPPFPPSTALPLDQSLVPLQKLPVQQWAGARRLALLVVPLCAILCCAQPPLQWLLLLPPQLLALHSLWAQTPCMAPPPPPLLKQCLPQREAVAGTWCSKPFHLATRC